MAWRCHTADTSPQVLPHSIPEHRPYFTLHLNRNCQNYSSVFHKPGYRHVLQDPRCALRSQDLEHFGRLGPDSLHIFGQNRLDRTTSRTRIADIALGTLTQNIMEFQRCSINGISYGEGVTEAMRGAALRQGRSDYLSPQEQDHQLQQMKADMIHTLNGAFRNRYLQPGKLTLVSPRLADEIATRTSLQRDHIIDFFRAMAICHTVIAEKPDHIERPFDIEYKAESPDEAALAGAARDVGFPFLARSLSTVEIEVLGTAERYTPLKVLEFNSTRKRMSVIVRTPEGKIVLYCKGADSVIYERLAANHDPDIREATSRDLESFANGGLRTLCVARRYLDEQDYLDWSAAYDLATAAMQDREEEIEKACNLVEKHLTILGATALEDKLQEGVPETIELLHGAGIKLWVLTGDKIQTAIEIGMAFCAFV